MVHIDITSQLDAAAAEQSGEEHELVLRGETFALPGGSLPWAASIEIARFAKEQASPFQAEQAGSIVALADALIIIFGADQYARLIELGVARSVSEMMVVVNAVTELYTGANAGESRGSAGGFKSTGVRRKLTSSDSTESTSAEPASDQNGHE